MEINKTEIQSLFFSTEILKNLNEKKKFSITSIS
jgi:hypothetical protein